MFDHLHNLSQHKRLFELIRQQEVATSKQDRVPRPKNPAPPDGWDQLKEQALRSFQD